MRIAHLEELLVLSAITDWSAGRDGFTGRTGADGAALTEDRRRETPQIGGTAP